MFCWRNVKLAFFLSFTPTINSPKFFSSILGKVLVSTQTHIDRLLAARLQADICNVGLAIVARTDAEAATQIDNNSDPRDAPFIIGSTNPNLEKLSIVLEKAAAAGKNIAEVQTQWRKDANLMTYFEGKLLQIEK